MAQGLQITLIVSSLFLDICFCCESNRSDNTKLAKKVDEPENLVMELEIEASTKAELQATQEELNNNFGKISKFKEDVAKFLVTTEKMNKNLVDPPALPFCID